MKEKWRVDPDGKGRTTWATWLANYKRTQQDFIPLDDSHVLAVQDDIQQTETPSVTYGQDYLMSIDSARRPLLECPVYDSDASVEIYLGNERTVEEGP